MQKYARNPSLKLVMILAFTLLSEKTFLKTIFRPARKKCCAGTGVTHVRDGRTFQAHCEITIWELVTIVKVFATAGGRKGSCKGNLYVMDTRTICPGALVPALQAG